MKIYREQKTKNVVYFASFKNGLTKIGTTTNLKNRLQGLKHQCGFEEVECFCVEGAYKTEGFFKKKFKQFNTFGEWFKIDIKSIEKVIENLEFKEIDIEKEEKTKNIPWISPFHERDKIISLHTRYANDIINALFIKETYNDYDKIINELLDWNKELGEEEYNEVLEDIESIRDTYDLFCYIDRHGDYSSYNIDFIFKKYFKNEISYKTLLEEGFEELKKINCKNSSSVYYFFETESKIATLIESWKMLDLTDKEIYSKIKEKI